MLQELNLQSIAIHQGICVHFYVSKAGIERNTVKLDTIRWKWISGFIISAVIYRCVYVYSMYMYTYESMYTHIKAFDIWA